MMAYLQSFFKRALLVGVLSTACAETMITFKDGSTVTGKLVHRTSNAFTIETKSGTHTFLTSTVRSVKHAEPGSGYRSASSLELPKQLPFILHEHEVKIQKIVDQLVREPSSERREAIRQTFPRAVQELLPSEAIMADWLSAAESSTRKTGKAGKEILHYVPKATKKTPGYAMVQVPKTYSPEKAWPVLIALHGTENKPGPIFSSFQSVVSDGCILVAPQIASRNYWSEPVQMQHLYKILGTVYRKYRIDPTRIMLAGGSGGGMGTWRITTTHPSLWCRAGSFSGAPAIQVQRLRALKDIPFYVLHGTRDHISIEGPRAMVAELKRLGYEHVFIEYDGDHFPEPKQKTEMAKWLAEATPRTTTSPRPALIQFAQWANAETASPSSSTP